MHTVNVKIWVRGEWVLQAVGVSMQHAIAIVAECGRHGDRALIVERDIRC